VSSRWKWKSEPHGGGQLQYRLRHGEVTVALVKPGPEGWFFHSPDGRVNTAAEKPPRTWAEPEDARKAAREWAEREAAKREAGA
jgi:predicted NUDIX family NTP pyrophosphohydrolase